MRSGPNCWQDLGRTAPCGPGDPVAVWDAAAGPAARQPDPDRRPRLAGRPDWAACVADPACPRYALCGRHVGCEFAFVGPDHARAAEAAGSRLAVCPACAVRIGAPPR